MTLPRRRSGWVRGLFATPRPARSSDLPTRPRASLRLEPLEDRAVPADLSLTLTDTPDPVTAGNNLTYTLGLSNAGPDAATSVSLTDVVPAGTTFVSFTTPVGFNTTTPPGGGTGPVTTTNPSFAAGATAGFTLVVAVNGNTSGGATLTDTATVTATNETNPSNNTATATTTVNASADLGVTAAGPTTVTAGSNLTYTLSLTNAGPSDAQNTTLTDMVPANATFVSVKQSNGPAFTATTPPPGGSGAVTEFLASFAAGASADFELVVHVTATAPPGSMITNMPSVRSDATDPTPANNTATATAAVVASADLQLTLAGPATVTAGSNLTYTLSLANVGPSASSGVTLTDAVPANTTFVSLAAPTGFTPTTPAVGGTGTVTATSPVFAPGTAVFTLVVKVGAATPSGASITNTATVVSTTADPDPANNIATMMAMVVTSADLSATNADNPDPVLPGGNLTYTLTVTNAGPSDAAGVTLTDAVPANTTFVSAAQTSGPSFTLGTPPVGGTGTTTAFIPTFATGASAAFTLVVKVDTAATSGSTITNTATVASATTDPDLTNNTPTATTTVATPVDLSVTKTDGQTEAVPGHKVTYTLTVTNTGPNAVTGATLTDKLPTDLTGVTFTSTATGGATGNTPTGTGNINEMLNLPIGSGVTYTVTGTVSPSATGSLANTATIAPPAGSLDTTPADNTATDTDTLTPQADLSLGGSVSPTSATAGVNLTYTLSLTNAGPSDAAGVTLTDAVPTNATFVSFTAPTGFTPTTPAVGESGMITATSPTFASGATATFVLVVNVNPGAAGSSVNTTATVAATTTDPKTDNNSFLTMMVVNGSANVGVTLAGGTGTVAAGSNVTYTITLTNIGPSNAAGVTLTDMIPTSSTFVSAAQASGSTFTITPPSSTGTGAVTATGALASGASATFTLVFRPNLDAAGANLVNTATVAATTPDPDTSDNSATATALIGPPRATAGRNVVASGPEDGSAQLFAPNATGTLAASGSPFFPFGSSGGLVRAATGDVNGDGLADTIYVTGPGVPVRFTVISGTDNATVLVPPTDPFGGNFTGGAFVAAGDFDGNGRAEMVITADMGGGPNVVIFERNADGTLAAPRAFFALGNPNFRGGARVAVGDVNGDGIPDLVVGAGFLGGPNVEVHDGKAIAGGDFTTLVLGGFFAFDGPDALTLRDGVFLAVGDVNGDGFGDLIIGGGPGGGPRVLVLSGKLLSSQGIAAAQAAPLANFFFGDPASRPGVRVASKDLDADGRGDLILGSGLGIPADVRAILGKNLSAGADPTTFQDLDVFGGQVLPNGVFVG
jgi:uncharacterized repeat protein (TIGR01451 family)